MSEACIPPTRDGSPYIRWVYTLFGSCVYNNNEIISNILGCASIACWLNAQFPQLIINYQNKSVNGLSLPFLLIWLLADTASLIGCILTNQLPFQLYLSMYFCTVDLALFFQYFYYTWKNSKSISIVYEDGNSDKELRPMSSIITFKESILKNSKKNYTFPSRKKESYHKTSTVLFASLLFTFYSTSSISSSISTDHHYGGNRKINSGLILDHASEYDGVLVGRVMAWISTALYLTSRLPQIWKNYKRKSVEGLSIFMFIFAVLGNLNYTLSIFTNPLTTSDPKYLNDAIPYIIGSVGTLSSDATIFIQWCIWKNPRRYRSLSSSSNNNKQISIRNGGRRSTLISSSSLSVNEGNGLLFVENNGDDDIEIIIDDDDDYYYDKSNNNGSDRRNLHLLDGSILVV